MYLYLMFNEVHENERKLMMIETILQFTRLVSSLAPETSMQASITVGKRKTP